MGKLVKIAADGSISEEAYEGTAPHFDRIVALLDGGYAELVPCKVKYEGRKRVAYADEDGNMKQLPFNRVATEAWLAALGKGPFRYEPRLRGPVVIVVSS